MSGERLEQLDRIEAELRRLADELRDLHARVAALEHAAGTPAAAPPGAAAPATGLRPPTPAPAAPPVEAPAALELGVDKTAIVALVGRLLVVLAGAFFLRALTDAGVFARPSGVAAGMAYAVAWILLADRAAARGRRASATVHGLAFATIALPLVFEATVRFHLWPTGVAAAALGAGAALALAVASRRRLRGLAWIATIGTLVATVALMLATGVLGPLAALLVLLGIAALWTGYVLDWVGLRWPVAIVVDLTVWLLSVRSVTPQSADRPAAALAIQVLLLALYLGSFATRTLVLNRDVIPFEVVQSAAALAVGLGGAAYVTRATGVGTLPLGLASLALGAGCYAVALVFVERRQRRRKNFHFYTAAASVFVLTGTALLLAPAPRAVVWSALALAAAGGGYALASVTLKAHAVLYTVAAAIAGGWIAHVGHGLGVPLGPPWPSATGGAVVGLLAAVATTLVVLAAGPGPYPTRFSRVPSLLLLALAVGGVLGLALAWAAGALVGQGPGAAGVMATLRTAALVAATLALAVLGRSPRLPEARWLVSPLLVVAGIKLLLEDLRVSRAATLFAALALYGTALILAPRLRRRT
jgi:hypothetical protein